MKRDKYTISLPSMLDVPNRVEADLTNSTRENNFLHGLGARKPKEELIIHPEILILSRLSLTPSLIQIFSKSLNLSQPHKVIYQ